MDERLAARFWYDNLTPGCINSFHELRDKFRANFLQQRRFQKIQEEILGIRQCSDESLRDYLQRFGREKLHMTDRSDGMMTGAFISGLRPGRLFKDLIARPPTSMEDFFTQAHNFIRADEANAENRLRDSRGAANDNKAGQSYRDASRRQRDRYIPRPNSRPNERTNVHKPSFTPLIKSPAEIYATSEGKAVLRPPPRMFAPAHRRDRTRYCEFHNDHGHDTNDCIDLRKEIEACIKSGRLSHLTKGAKAQRMRRLGAIASTIHSLLKFPIPSGVAIVRGDIPRNNECFQVSRKREREPAEVTTPTPQENDSEKEEVEINSLYPN
ncbi:retrotransposon gag domain-containing protein [Artemisia annua]|uniref:Retrotransposon gag domain-containing protein n=1 Tax=Artemisia annua TaxID=35608 RepID=A0A2U1NCA5_ARTAN|nr:retrotransposon gag domain-containing protein [Artemisia annua]